jgi:hypothetical protein
VDLAILPARPEAAPPIERLLTALWAALVVSIPFQRMWTLPLVGEKLQPPEVAGAILIAAAAWRLLRTRQLPAPGWTDAGAFAWWLSVTLATLVAARRGVEAAASPWLEWVGTTFLVLLYAALRCSATAARLRLLPVLLLWMGIAAAAAALAGFALALAGRETRLAGTIVFPYLGSVPRATGFTPAPAMVATLVVTGMFGWAAAADAGSRTSAAWVTRIALLAASFVATQAKVAVALAGGLIAAGIAGRRQAGCPARLLSLALCALTAFYLLASHVVLLPAARRDALTAARYIGEPFGSVAVAGREWLAAPSNYWFNKRASWIAVRETWPAGLGPGGHNAFVARLMREGRHPANLWAADPHSTYLGAAAELGVAGLAGVLAFGAALILDLRRVGRGQAPLRRARSGDDRRHELPALLGRGGGSRIAFRRLRVRRRGAPERPHRSPRGSPPRVAPEAATGPDPRAGSPVRRGPRGPSDARPRA